MANATQKIVTPVGELAWVFITGQGKKDLNDKDRFCASVKYPADSAALKSVQAVLKEFWDNNKPKGKARPKSTGIKEELDKQGDPTGFFLVNFWTGTTFPDGSPKVVKTYSSKGTEVALGGKKIGNGSRGAISGVAAIYQNGPNCGVTLYLNAIQLTKFVEFTDDAGFGAVEDDDEDGWTGDDLNEDGFEAQDDPEPSTPAKVRL